MPVPPTPPCKLTPEGGLRRGITYDTVRHINKGQMANAYEARDSSGARVFLKAYISPTPAVEWYEGYLAYVKKLNHRIATSTAAGYCEKALDSFEAKVGHSKHATFFQVLEFVDGGRDLETILGKAATVPGSLTWPQRLSMAKVMLASLRQLHDAKIVHCDLKPPNIIMEAVDAAIGFRPKLIDLDSSIMSDTEAPWHGRGQGYVGSPNYYSPEHLRGGNSKPLPASDVYTSALIIYDLLGQGNPYRSDDPEDYNNKALSGNPPQIRLKGKLSSDSAEGELGALLKRALSPNPTERPAMRDLHSCLLLLNPASGARPSAPGGAPSTAPAPVLPPTRTSTTTPAPTTPTPTTSGKPPSTPAKYPPAPAPSTTLASTGRLELLGDKERVNFGVSCLVGRRLLERISTQGVFASEPQFELIFRTNEWILKPLPTVKNSTAVNDKIVLDECSLTPGDVISLIGKSGQQAMKLTVSFTSTSVP
jgi:serine/threonine protein kinase